ncbi:MAG: DUF1858 domain-containing protein [bacterium]|nr:DUF1858 domain-containing protein [bacterium]
MAMRRIGTVADFPSFPAPLTIDESVFFLVRRGSSYALLSNVCPHTGGDVEHRGDRFECSIHGWRFALDGQCLTAPSHRLRELAVEERGGELFVDADYLRPPRTAFEIAQRSSVNCTFTLHGHACVEIRRGDFSLLTDPWLDGPAVMGAWYQYPKPSVDPATLHPSAIWITHEHSDHFHPPTLRHFDRATPIWFPDFPNQRMQRTLMQLGFRNLHPVRFGETLPVADGVTVTAYEPESIWNDSLSLFSIDGFHVLNISDAGLNTRIANILPPIDVLLTQFSPGASGYPLCWRQVSAERCREHYDRARKGYLTMIRKAVDIYRAQFVLPFASHFVLGHPDHDAYDTAIGRNTLDDVVAAFRDTGVPVIDLLHGESWESGRGRFRRVYAPERRSQLYTRAAIDAYRRREFSAEDFARNFPSGERVTPAEVCTYFERLNDVPEMVFCEDLRVRVHVLEALRGAERFVMDFDITDHVLRVRPAAEGARPGLEIWITQQVLGYLIHEDVAWDEPMIGYLVEFHRDPDVYHPYFWRVLHQPYYRKVVRPASPSSGSGITGETAIAAVLQADPIVARILTRYGMHCVACGRAHEETLAQGARKHGIDDATIERLVAEINRVLSSEVRERVA